MISASLIHSMDFKGLFSTMKLFILFADFQEIQYDLGFALSLYEYDVN
jgi:hypothetical protein